MTATGLIFLDTREDNPLVFPVTYYTGLVQFIRK